MQNLNQRTVNNLLKGLITEAGELTFPEGASIDELNCILSRDGSRSRRFGVEFETGNELSSFAVDPAKTFSVGQWDNPGGIAGLTFMVIQSGSTLYFFNSGQAPYSSQYSGLSVDLSAYQISGKDVSLVAVQVTSISSALVVASEAIDTIYLSYDGVAIAETQINFRIRDFDWQSDICDLTQKVAIGDATPGRKYDTLNTGWIGNEGTTVAPVLGGTIGGGFLIPSGTGTAALTSYTSTRGAYPPLTHPWYSGKNSSGDFDISDWERVYSGSSLIGNGHFVLDFFNKDRNTAAGLTGVPTETESTRFSAVATYASRVFYAGLSSTANSGKVLYSRIVESLKESSSCTIIGECFQQNDPTAEYYSDLLDTDGGVISIPEAYNIRKLYTHNQYLYVFADNGVWVISGADNSFTAASYYIAKVSNVGIYSASSFVAAEGVPFWWSKYGIHTFAYDETSGFPMEQNLSIQTVQSYWDDIDTNAKERVVAAYDRVNKQIFWLYPTNGETLINKRTKALVLNIPLQAFYPWEIADSVDYAMGLYFFDAYGSAEFEDTVVDSLDADVVDGLGATVWVAGFDLIRESSTRLGILAYTGGFMTVALFSSKTFLDWGAENYDSFVEAGHDFGGDLLLKKSAPYVTVYTRSTEEGYTITLDPINPSGLFLGAYWDFKDYASTRQQVYKPKPTPVANASDLSDTGQNKSVVTTRLKVRGSGRSVRLRFESEEGKNFVLLGYSVLVGSNVRF